jgi:hypothetical protein
LNEKYDFDERHLIIGGKWKFLGMFPDFSQNAADFGMSLKMY